jgi:hypothetical protein
MRNQGKPRRAGKRWLEGAPEYVLDCFDNKGKTADRYTVLFGGSLSCGSVPYLGMSESPTHPQGVSMWGELRSHEAAGYRHRSGQERVRWLDLPDHIRRHVVSRATEE